MTEKVLYIADDGTEFEYEDDCRNYETAQEILPIFEKVQMWDCFEKLIPTPTNWEEIENALDEMHFVRGSGVEELWNAIYNADLENMMLSYDTFRREVNSSVSETDLLMFNSDMDEWVNVNYLFNEYRRILKNFS